MELNELRIGNYYHQEGFFRIERDKPRIDIPERDFILNKETLVWILTEGELDYIKPIPLTEDWLLRFGLTEKEYGDYVLTDYGWGILFNYDEDEKEWYVTARDEYQITTLKHVHQLQNLFFCLTGQELTIKELAK